MSIDAQPALFDLSLDDVPHSSPEQRDDTTILIESWAGAKNRIGRHDVARQAVQETSLTAQEELGGGPYQQRQADLPTPKRLDEAIRGSEDWHSDIIDAVERFGLNDITTTFHPLQLHLPPTSVHPFPTLLACLSPIRSLFYPNPIHHFLRCL